MWTSTFWKKYQIPLKSNIYIFAIDLWASLPVWDVMENRMNIWSSTFQFFQIPVKWSLKILFMAYLPVWAVNNSRMIFFFIFQSLQKWPFFYIFTLDLLATLPVLAVMKNGMNMWSSTFFYFSSTWKMNFEYFFLDFMAT